MGPLRVLIVDDHPVFLAGLAALLNAEDRTEIVGQAVTGADAISLAAQTQPDAVIMDLQLPDMNGIEVTRTITHASRHIGVLVLTMFDDDSVFAAMRAGARGYLLKGAGQAEILGLIAGGSSNAEIAERLFLAPKTVRNHVSNIFSKLQVADRAQAIVRARKAGLGD